MRNWRLDLRNIPFEQRASFVSAFGSRLAAGLFQRFPDWLHLLFASSIRIAKGSFRGLSVHFKEYDTTRDYSDFGIEGYFPVVQSWGDKIARLQYRYMSLPGEKIISHFFLGILLIPALLAIPFIGLYRMATLSLWRVVVEAEQQVHLTLSEMHAATPHMARLKRTLSEGQRYALLFVAALGATFLSFWLADHLALSEATETAVQLLGWLLGLLSLSLLIAAILKFLGFDMHL